MNELWLILLILHFLACALVLLGIKSGFLKLHSYMFFIALFLPFWGIVLILLLHFQIFLRADGTKQIQMEKLKTESELYKSIRIDTHNTAQTAIPMEEALLVNSSKERRSLILDVLNDNPKEYIEFLQKAGNNDDTEVVHYAVTAMVEISKENDERLHALEQEYAAHPESMKVLSAYLDFLWNCLSQNMMQGQVEQINRELFCTLMKKKLLKNAKKEDFIRMVHNELARKNYTSAFDALERMKSRYASSEEYYLLKIKYFASIGNGTGIQQVLSEIKENQIYISSKGKEIIAFWEK